LEYAFNEMKNNQEVVMAAVEKMEGH